jgi:hypothetical protein
MSDMHIPDVARMYGTLDMAKKKLDKIISEYKALIRSGDVSDSELKEMFYRAGIDERIKASLAELSIILDDAYKLIDEIKSSSSKRGRKFRHFQLMLEQTMAKIHRVCGEKLQKYGLWTENQGLWTDIPE